MIFVYTNRVDNANTTWKRGFQVVLCKYPDFGALKWGSWLVKI